MKTLYVTDLDGTLLNTEDKISEFSIEIINNLVAQGMIFTYATARSLNSASIVAKGLSMNIPVIVYNGGAIIHPQTKEVLYSLRFTKDEMSKVQKLIHTHDIAPLVYSYIDGAESISWLENKENEGISHYIYSRKGDKRLNPVKNATELYNGDIFYYTCIGEKVQLLPLYDALKYDGDYTCILQQELYRKEYWCEIMPKKATKANAIEKLKSILNCDKIVSFGDAINDISMFKISDESYAVNNAVAELKEHATAIIGDNNEDSVAKWLLSNARFLQ